MIFVALYVDDLVLACNNDEMLQTKALCERFELTDLGQLIYFLGMEIDQDFISGNISVRQTNLPQTYWRSSAWRTAAPSRHRKILDSS